MPLVAPLPPPLLAPRQRHPTVVPQSLQGRLAHRGQSSSHLRSELGRAERCLGCVQQGELREGGVALEGGRVGGEEGRRREGGGEGLG